MDTQELMRDFQKLTDVEVYYKRVYDKRGEKYANNEYLDSFDFMDVVNRNPEFATKAPEHAFVLPDEISDSHHFFSSNTDASVTIFRHQRYTPVFNHKHVFFEFVIVLQGSCIHVTNDSTFVMKEGEMCLIPPGVYHGVYVSSNSIVLNMHIRKSFFTDVWSNFAFKKNTLSTFFSSSLYGNDPSRFLRFCTNNDDDIKNLILEMYIEHHFETIYKTQVIESQTIVLFSRLLRRYESSIIQHSSSKYSNEEAGEFITYIEQNIDSIDLESMAKHFNYSPQYISKKIKSCSGTTFSGIVKQIRYGQAKKMLANTQMSVREISNALGYMNAENFTRSFKAMSGMSPKEYKKSLSGK
ncbi:MAG: helix-turn-helix domain-containing protein [Clostridia bacterium]|nr:helix-turn-helix domain-containing protein [Clostridia bacterium]